MLPPPHSSPAADSAQPLRLASAGDVNPREASRVSLTGMDECRPRNGRRHLALWPYPTLLSGEEDGGGCWRNGLKENDVRTRGQDSGDAREKELICSKVRKLPSRARGGKRGERSEVRLIHSPQLAEKKKSKTGSQ